MTSRLLSERDCPRHIVTLATNITMAFRLIPACPEGFLMGSRGFNSNEEPIHRVVVPEDFWMSETPVTQEQYAFWKDQSAIEHRNRFDGEPNHPAEQVNWYKAIEFCETLTERAASQFPASHPFASLSIEAQWEYACRAGTQTEYYTGDGKTALGKAGWFNGNCKSTCPVASDKLGNRFGLHDMHGNVWEWCMDRWDEGAYRRRWDGIELLETYQLNEQFGDRSNDNDPLRVVRGGSWNFSADWCRAASRFRHWAGNSLGRIGFRVCLVRSPIAKQVSAVAPVEP